MTLMLILLFLLTTTINALGQTIQELEYELSYYSSSERYGDKIDKAKELQKIDPFNYSAIEYICRYYDDRKIDSVSIFFDNLVAKFPENTEPYLLRSELLFLEIDYRDNDTYTKNKVKYLNQGLNINTKDSSIIYNLAETYYKDFISPLEKEKDFGLFVIEDDCIDSTLTNNKKHIKKSTYEYSADSSLNYFYKLWDLSYNKRDIIYFPIRQLECYLNQIEKTSIPIDAEKKFNQCYFPSSYFANLADNWECDFTSDYLFEIESGKRTAEWLAIQLSDLEEECLYNRAMQPNTTIYRFTWLRSFHHPIAIRIEKIGSSIMLYWKVGKGAGGYRPKGLKKSGKKKINANDWLEFVRIINESDFDNLPNKEYISMTDGATWTLERKTSETFKAHDTNWPSPKIKDACLYLLDLTKIKVKDDDKY